METPTSLPDYKPGHDYVEIANYEGSAQMNRKYDYFALELEKIYTKRSLLFKLRVRTEIWNDVASKILITIMSISFRLLPILLVSILLFDYMWGANNIHFVIVILPCI